LVDDRDRPHMRSFSLSFSLGGPSLIGSTDRFEDSKSRADWQLRVGLLTFDYPCI
jgi:hypothetical protein